MQDGRLGPAEPLPTVRELAAQLKVSPATVAAAYRLLRARGLTAADGRRGTRIIPRPPTRGRIATSRLPAGALDLASGSPDPALLPPLDLALRSLATEPALYDAPPHLPALATFAAREFEADGVPAGSLTIVSGGLDGIDRVLREHLRPGDRVAIEDPGFPALHDLITASGYVATTFSVDDQGPTPATLDAALQPNCRAVVITTRGQNPTGAALNDERAADLRPLLRRRPDLLLVENDPCGPVAGAAPITLVDASRHRWAHIKSVAKSLGPDLRVAFVAGDAVTVTRVEGRHALGPRRVSHLLQQLVLALWSDPSAGRLLARASDIYLARRSAFIAALSARGIPAHGASGLNVWIPLSHEGHVVQELAEHGWVVAPGEPFRLGASPGVRVTIAALQPADAERLASAVAGAMAGHRRPRA